MSPAATVGGGGGRGSSAAGVPVEEVDPFTPILVQGRGLRKIYGFLWGFSKNVIYVMGGVNGIFLTVGGRSAKYSSKKEWVWGKNPIFEFRPIPPPRLINNERSLMVLAIIL